MTVKIKFTGNPGSGKTMAMMIVAASLREAGWSVQQDQTRWEIEHKMIVKMPSGEVASPDPGSTAPASK